MILTAIGTIYDNASGFKDNYDLAIKLVRACSQSSVSIEVKGAYLKYALSIYEIDNASLLFD